MENKAQLMSERSSVSRPILNSPVNLFPLSQKDNFDIAANNNILKDTHNFVLKYLWM